MSVDARIGAELALLRRYYDEVDYIEDSELHWFRVASVRTTPDWSLAATEVVFSVTQGYPGTVPYGFYVPAELMYAGNPPDEQQASYQPPFAGTWRFLSWDIAWEPKADVTTGANLWGWVRSFVKRFEEGK